MPTPRDYVDGECPYCGRSDADIREEARRVLAEEMRSPSRNSNARRLAAQALLTDAEMIPMDELIRILKHRMDEAEAHSETIPQLRALK